MPLNLLFRPRIPPIASAFTSNRILLYAVLSIVATLTTIGNACRNYSNFYSVAISLSRSGRSLLVLANFGFLSALLSGRILQRIFFGPLQAREVERLYDQTWMFVTESLLAFTIFRDDFDIPFVIMFGFLLFVKCFHWLMADRVESMDQVPYPGPPLLFHVRMNTLFLILWFVDFMMLVFAIESTLSNGVGGMVLFANEYAILMASALNSVARYALSNLEIRRARTRGGTNAPAWENKSMYIFYIELVTDFLKLIVYLTFFLIVLTFYGLPLNMIRDVYLTARSFTSRLRALVRYHNATRDMDRRYPNATEEELTAMSDRTCIICREEMVASPQNQNPPAEGQAAANANPDANTAQDGPNVTPKKLPCGHIFHFQCLRSWLERQQSCPTCRRTVLETEQPNRNTAQGAARNARPGPPQPGAAPGGGQPAQPPANLGWLGRFLGLPVPPPLAPGQFPNGQIPPQFAPPGAAAPQQIPPNAGWPAPGQQVPPGYLYPYPYQLPPQQLQPPPVYRGFYGPGGAWQPWGVDAQWLAQGQNVQGQPAPPQDVPPQMIPPAQPAAVPVVPQPPAPPVAQAAPAAPTPTTPSQPSTSTDPSTSANGSASSNDGPSTPRDAAAQAALRRMNPSRSSAMGADGTPSPAPATTSSADSVASATTREIATPPTQPTGDASAVAPSPTPTPAPAVPLPNVGSSAASPVTGAGSRIDVPSLIPLYDFSQYQRNLRGQTPQTGASQQARPTPTIPPMQGPQQTTPGVAQPFRAPSHTQASTRSSTQDTRYRPSAPRAPLSQLPPTLNDEQLARLDRLTRDAIDERLRVLEGVSGAVYRCIEELTRIRSVLPPRDQALVASPSAAPIDGPAALNADLASSATTASANPVSGSQAEGKLDSSSQSALGPPQSEPHPDSDLDDPVREQTAASSPTEAPPETSGSGQRTQHGSPID